MVSTLRVLLIQGEIHAENRNKHRAKVQVDDTNLSGLLVYVAPAGVLALSQVASEPFRFNFQKQEPNGNRPLDLGTNGRFDLPI